MPPSQLQDLVKKLTLYAEIRLDKIGFSCRSELDVFKGEDFAMEAITRLIDGRRSWDPDKHPDILIHLIGIVKSLIWNHNKKSKNSLVESLRSLDLDEFDELSADGTGFQKETPETTLINQEQWQLLETFFGADEEGYIHFVDWLEDKPPRDIAKEYGVPVTQINNTVKKGKRFIKRLFGS